MGFGKIKSWLGVLLAGFLMVGQTGCLVTYRDYPKNMAHADPPPKKLGHLYYHVEGVSMGGGYIALRDAIKTRSPFQSTEVSEEISKKGWHLLVRIENRPPSLPSLIFGYISLCLLTLTPAWSTKGGTNLYYEVYKDGTLRQTYDYKVTRKGVLWIVTLPLIWANLFTVSEEKAFVATANQFFRDSLPLFQG